MAEGGRANDWVRLEGMEFDACHGVNESEKETPSCIEVDLEIRTDLTRSGRSDDLADTIDYGAVYSLVNEVIGGESRNLLERLATDIADKVLARLPCELVRVRIRKLRPAVGGRCRAAEIEISRSSDGTDISRTG